MNYDEMLVSFVKGKQEEQQRIDTLTSQMRPFAETPEGQNSLRAKLSDIEESKDVRAAAAQALNPNFKVNIGKQGELSFSARTEQAIGSTPNLKSQRQVDIEGKAISGQASNFAAGFADTFEAIRAETDPLKVTEMYSALQSSATSFVASREASIKTRLAGSLGLSAVTSEIQRQIQLDHQWAKDNGLPYQGDSSETLAVKQQLSILESKRDGLTKEDLSKDPEIAALSTRMDAAKMLVQQKYALAGKSMEEATNTEASFVEPSRAKAVGVAIGANVEDPAVLKSLQEKMATESSQMRTAEAIANASMEELLVLDSSGGLEGKMAGNVLTTKVTDPALLNDLRSQIKNFSTVFPSEKLTNAEKAMVTPMQGVFTPKQKAEEQAMIQANKAKIVLERFKANRVRAFESSVENWAPPTDPNLAELPQVVQDLKRINKDSPVTIDAIIGALDWEGADRATKVASLANYISANAAQVGDSAAFGEIPNYPNRDIATQLVTSKVISSKARVNSNRTAVDYAFGFSPNAIGNNTPSSITFTDYRDLYDN